MSLKAIFLLSLAVTAVAGHGLTTDPRGRGALNFNAFGVKSKGVRGAPKDTCPHCLNAGGPGSIGGGWSAYNPLGGNSRTGFGICGDKAGSNAHMKNGRFKNPASMPFAANYEPGGVANFGYTVTANHRGYLEFYLCDVENNPGQDIQFSTFAKDCVKLERVPHASCESGNDPDCGPIDPKSPGRWVMPCGNKAFGGENGKMAYRIPNKKINVGVLQTYWMVRVVIFSVDILVVLS